MFKRNTRLKIGLTLMALALSVTGVLAACGEQKPADTGKVRNFTLYVREGTLMLPDGKKVWMFGYTDNPNQSASVPGPTIVVDEGDTVNITLINDKDPTKTQVNAGDGHTVHLHGLDLPSQMDGDPMTAAGMHSVMPGTRFTYHFVANQPGTYWYHCHEAAAEHMQMGMYGALVVQPKGDPHRAYADTPEFDKSYTFLLSDVDTSLHALDFDSLHKANTPEPNWSQYRPDYFLINGKAWPDTMRDPTTWVTATVGQTVLIRLINGGNVAHAIHTHGYHFQVIATDGRKLSDPYEKDTLSIAPGERYDIILKLDMVGRYMIHDHFEQYTTNNGESMGGMVTMINVNNQDGSNPIPMPGTMMDDD
jgi:FtsP/CotA-like multicopper oxidase with cupredoxin domain